MSTVRLPRDTKGCLPRRNQSPEAYQPQLVPRLSAFSGQQRKGDVCFKSRVASGRAARMIQIARRSPGGSATRPSRIPYLAAALLALPISLLPERLPCARGTCSHLSATFNFSRLGRQLDRLQPAKTSTGSSSPSTRQEAEFSTTPEEI